MTEIQLPNLGQVINELIMSFRDDVILCYDDVLLCSQTNQLQASEMMSSQIVVIKDALYKGLQNLSQVDKQGSREQAEVLATRENWE